jgi:hypothetical protein
MCPNYDALIALGVAVRTQLKCLSWHHLLLLLLLLSLTPPSAAAAARSAHLHQHTA